MKFYSEIISALPWIFTNPFQPSVAFHIETSHLICSANQIKWLVSISNATLGWNELMTCYWVPGLILGEVRTFFKAYRKVLCLFECLNVSIMPWLISHLPNIISQNFTLIKKHFMVGSHQKWHVWTRLYFRLKYNTLFHSFYLNLIICDLISMKIAGAAFSTTNYWEAISVDKLFSLSSNPYKRFLLEQKLDWQFFHSALQSS